MNHSLNGKDWKVIWLLPNEWIWRKLWEQKDLNGWSPPVNAHWIPATVPGCVQADALDAGLIPDPNYALNSLQCEWTSERDWVYIRELGFPQEAAGKKVRLHFEGVDYSCHVYLNGKHLGDHEGMYLPFDFDVTDELRQDAANRLMAIVDRAPDEQWQIGWTSKVRIWKARFAYDWDWCTRLIPVGIWDDVSLIITGPAYLQDVQIYTQAVEDGGSVQARIHVGSDVAQEVFAECFINYEGTTIAESKLSAKASPEQPTLIEEDWDVPDPHLWWPNGYGEQPLYMFHVTLKDADGNVLDKQSKSFGLRSLRWISNEGAPEDALPYTVEVNGRRVFLKGWNWTPLDHFYGKDLSDRYEHFLKLAKAANANLLRVWGGGLLEKEVFYDLCDRYGIMVWQEFIQSSSGIDNNPSADPEYLAYIEKQARGMVPRRRHHPSLAVWSGGNELMYDNYKPVGLEHPAIAVLAKVVEELDQGRMFLPTSPSGPLFGVDLNQKGKMHDVHGPWKYTGVQEHYHRNNEMDALLYSEFGVDGAANMETLLRIATEEELWPPSGENAIWTHHGSWWIQWEQIRALFGEISDLESYVKASQWLQAEGLRYAIEANRRRKWHCSGTFPWQYNEAWPNTSCTNCIDYFGKTKPAYWWVRRAYAPLLVSAQYETISLHGKEELTWQIHLNNSLPSRWSGDIQWQMQSLDGRELASGVNAAEIPADSHVSVSEHSYPLGNAPGYLVLVLRACGSQKQLYCVNHYLFSNSPEPIMSGLREIPKTSVSMEEQGKALALTNTGEDYALGVLIQGVGELLSDNYLTLAPGETRVIHGTGQGKPRLEGWNLT